MRKSLLFAIAGFVLLLTCSLKSYAVPLVFADVFATRQNPTTGFFERIDLFTHPGAVLIPTSYEQGNEHDISFGVYTFGVLPAGTNNILRLTLDRGGSLEVWEQTLPYNLPPIGCCNDFIWPHVFAFDNIPYIMPDGSAPPGSVLFTLTVDIIGSSPDFVIPSGPNAGQQADSYTYSFYVVRPVPEPTTILLLGSALVGIAAKVRKRRKAV